MLQLIPESFRSLPKPILIAVIALWLMLLVRLTDTAFNDQFVLSRSSTSLFENMILFLIADNVGRAFLYKKIAEGKRWARNIFWVLAVAFSLLALTTFSNEPLGFDWDSWQGILTLLFTGADLTATVLLMQAPKTFWK